MAKSPSLIRAYLDEIAPVEQERSSLRRKIEAAQRHIEARIASCIDPTKKADLEQKLKGLLQKLVAAQRRHETKIADCAARHFPELDDPKSIDTIPKLWAYLTLRLRPKTQAVARTAGLGERPWNLGLWRAYSLLHRLGIPWAPEPPYSTRTFESHEEAQDELTRITKRLEREDVQPQLAPSPPGEDPSAFIPAKACRNDRITSPKQLKALLDKEPDSERGIRRKHRGQHLYVHAGDWYRWNGEQDRLLEEARNSESENLEVQEVERMKAKIRAENEAKARRK